MLALALLFGGKNALVISLSGRNHVKNDAGQFVSGSRDPGRPSQAGAPLAIKDAPIGSTPFQGLRRSPHGATDATGTPAGFGGKNFSSALLNCGDRSRPRKRSHGCCETWTRRFPLPPARCRR